MKNFLFFIAGMIVMLLVWIFVANSPYIKGIVDASINAFENNQEEKYYMPGLTLFSEGKEETINIKNKQIKIFQCLYQNVALAKIGDFPNDIVILLLGNEDDYFYDDQKIQIASGKAIKQVGIYKYETKNEDFKTVPAIAIK